jgi:hypothetical protein
MHLEILVEDSSGAKLIEILLPKLIGQQSQRPTWRVHPYKGIGRIPPNLSPATDAKKRILLDHLPRILRGYRNTPGVDAVVVILDCDRRDCVRFLQELKGVAESCDFDQKTIFRLAIEEVEAWYFGDRSAVLKAYPRAKRPVLDAYQQDSICGTWERLAEALAYGRSKSGLRTGERSAGVMKHEWADAIGRLMDVENNASPSFQKLRDGLRRVVMQAG